MNNDSVCAIPNTICRKFNQIAKHYKGGRIEIGQAK